MSLKLKDRIDAYQATSDFKLLARLPVMMCINGRSFARLTQLLDKPYCPQFAECMFSTMMHLCMNVEGALFAYQHNDEVVLISRNDQTNETHPWYNGSIQKICSTVAALATSHFQEVATSLQLNITGKAIFTAQVFAVPTIGEAINTFIYKQQQNFHTSIQSACLYNLITKYDKNTIKEMLTGLSVDEKIDLLLQECDISYNDYPVSFRRGVAAYKVPKVIDGNMKNKWYLNHELPFFTKDQSFLSNILKNGMDIFRQDSIEE